MEKNNTQKFKETSNYFFKKIEDYIITQSSDYIGVMNIRSEDNTNDSEVLHTTIVFTNNTLNKSIEISFVYNSFYGKIYSSSRIKKNNLNTELRDSFSINDYCEFKKKFLPIGFKIGSVLLPNQLWEDISTYMGEYFYFIRNLFSLEEMHKIIFTSYWMNIPMDWGPYK